MESETNTNESALSERDELFAVMVAGGKSIRQAGAELELSVTQSYRVAGNDVFRRRVNQIRTELVTDALGKLAGLATNATDKLRDLLNCEDPGVALRASTAILDRFTKLSDAVDLRARVEALEAQAKERSA